MISSVLLLATTYFSPHLDYSIHFLWHRLHHFGSYSMYLELSRYFFFYDVYQHCISNSRMFIVPILTWSIWNTVSVHWKLLVHRVATIHKIGTWTWGSRMEGADKSTELWRHPWLSYYHKQISGSDCGSAGRAVASESRDPLFKASFQHN